MSDAPRHPPRFAHALEAKANAGNQTEDDLASDELIEAVGDVEQNAAEMPRCYENCCRVPWEIDSRSKRC